MKRSVEGIVDEALIVKYFPDIKRAIVEVDKGLAGEPKLVRVRGDADDLPPGILDSAREDELGRLIIVTEKTTS